MDSHYSKDGSFPSEPSQETYQPSFMSRDTQQTGRTDTENASALTATTSLQPTGETNDAGKRFVRSQAIQCDLSNLSDAIREKIEVTLDSAHNLQYYMTHQAEFPPIMYLFRRKHIIYNMEDIREAGVSEKTYKSILDQVLREGAVSESEWKDWCSIWGASVTTRDSDEKLNAGLTRETFALVSMMMPR